MMKTFILKILGFCPSIVNRLDGASKSQIAFAVFIVWLVSSFSALLFATTISNLCFSGGYFWLIAPIWFLFIYALEALVIGSDVDAKTVMFLRVIICLILAFFHGLTLDTLAFGRDIRNEKARQYNVEIISLENSYDKKIEPLLIKKEALHSENQKLLEAEKKSRDRVFKEIDKGNNGRPPGRGAFAKYKEQMHAADSLLFANGRETNDMNLQKLDSEIAIINAEKTNKVNSIVKPESAGLRDNINTLHLIVWGEKGTFFDKFYFILLMLAGFMFETLVLISKLAFSKSFKAYQEEVNAERLRVSAQQVMNHNIANEIEGLDQKKKLLKLSHKLLMDIELLKIQQSHELSDVKAKSRFRKMKRDSDRIFNVIKEVDSTDQQIRKESNGLYENYVKPLVTDFQFEKIREIAEDMKKSNL